MAHEIETKVLDIDADEVRGKLLALGAEKKQDTRLVVDWYRIKDEKEGEESWFLRIRSNTAGKHEVTWKAKSEVIGIARKHKEINFFIDEPEKLADLFEGLGLEAYAHQEKDRISYTYKDWSFDIDMYPGMLPFLEIEGESEKHIQEALVLLGLEKNPTWATGERILIQERYGLDWYQMRF